MGCVVSPNLGLKRADLGPLDLNHDVFTCSAAHQLRIPVRMGIPRERMKLRFAAVMPWDVVGPFLAVRMPGLVIIVGGIRTVDHVRIGAGRFPAIQERH